MTECSTIRSSSDTRAMRAMRAKSLHSADRLCRIVFGGAFRCALVALLSLASSVASAQSSTATPASRASANASATAARESRAEAAINAGRIIYNQRCEVCHFIDSNAQKIGPGLKGLFARARLADGRRVTDASVAQVIGEGGKDMPGYNGQLKSGQLQALIAFLKSH
jgi:cytochrome c